jgi:predicted ArsR family transcriptional regulator
LIGESDYLLEGAMSLPGWAERYLGTTRGRIVSLLRRRAATVNELAHELGLTDNAVRAHLAGLERDGLVEQQGVVRSVGKPAYVYGLTPVAESMVPKAYGLVLERLLRVVRGRLGDREVEEMLEEVGRELALERGRLGGDLRARSEAAAVLLGQLGGLAEVEEHPEGCLIRGYSCPLASVAREFPHVCRFAEVLLEEMIGARVEERCERGEVPRCRFLVHSA